jgi:hypothetical protein
VLQCCIVSSLCILCFIFLTVCEHVQNTCFTCVRMFVMQSYWDERPHRQARLNSIRNAVDASGLIWFVVGNIWVFGDDLAHCTHPQSSPIYEMCVAMLVINYIQICLPCIVAILLIPVFCFCMPCLIRILARMQTARAPVVRTLDF